MDEYLPCFHQTLEGDEAVFYVQERNGKYLRCGKPQVLEM
jgi:hypothetical protein